MGNISVALQSGSKGKTVWSLSGDQGDPWHPGMIPIPPSDGAFKVIMIGNKGSMTISRTHTPSLLNVAFTLIKIM